MQRKTCDELIWQLQRLPGGAQAALPDFFGHLLAGPTRRDDQGEHWPLPDNAALLLRQDALLVRIGEHTHELARIPPTLHASATEAGLSPLLLGLLALATGDLPGDKRLKALLPKVDGAAKDLMLMTVCRLCG